MAELKPVAPFDIVVFGGTGDLALHKLVPSLYHRWCDGQIPPASRIFAAARTPMSREAYLKEARAALAATSGGQAVDASCWADFAARVDYVAVDAADGGEGWADLKAKLEAGANGIRLFYLATPPSLYGAIAAGLARAGVAGPTSRVVLEKPIGYDLASARAVNDAVGAVFPESAIFRIDHYLGKETVQNLLILRFTNALFEPLWNSHGIDHVQITVAESIGAAGRASYYDGAGALRDMVQNHMLQLLCLVAMEPPGDLEADEVRDEKLKVLRALRPIRREDAAKLTVRAQYTDGLAGGERAPGYAKELGRDSGTETFVALKAHIDNWRWAGTPFYLRTGKRMGSRRSEIVVQFKPVPHAVTPPDAGTLHPNRLVLRLQPDEAMRLHLMTKEPGPGGLKLRYVPLNLSYADTFKARYPDAYERLLLAVVRDNLALFMRRDEVEAAWSWTDAILDAWSGGSVDLMRYPAGSDGPAAAATLIARDDRTWFDEPG
jgi:glucose-6-phosphate 1-dehydrogenase